MIALAMLHSDEIPALAMPFAKARRKATCTCHGPKEDISIDPVVRDGSTTTKTVLSLKGEKHGSPKTHGPSAVTLPSASPGRINLIRRCGFFIRRAGSISVTNLPDRY